MLLDSQGHIRLTDFGLSRVPLIDRNHEKHMQLKKNLDTMRRRSKPISPSKRHDVNHERKPSQKDPDSKKSSRSTKNLLGTPDYLAPELLLGKSNGPEVDWWAFGVCLYEWAYGLPPFTDDSVEGIFRNILGYSKNDIIFYLEWPDDIDMSPQARNLIERLLHPEPNQRIQIAEIKKHNFFDLVDWKSICNQPAPFIPRPHDESDTSYFNKRTNLSDIGELLKRQNDKRESNGSNSIKENSGQLQFVDSAYDDPEDRRKFDRDHNFKDFTYTNFSVLEEANLQNKADD